MQIPMGICLSQIIISLGGSIYKIVYFNISFIFNYEITPYKVVSETTCLYRDGYYLIRRCLIYHVS